MSEEQKKPKATLIKKKKIAPSPEAVSEEPEKKKIVVVKKKVVVVKKTAARPGAPKPEEPAAAAAHAPQEAAREARPAVESVRLQEQPVRRPTFETQRYDRGPRDQGDRAHRSTRIYRSPGAPPGPSSSRDRRPPAGPPRPLRRDGAPPIRRDRPGGAAPPAKPEAPKPGAKKVFKTKKKGSFGKARYEEHQEKLLAQKKKLAPKANPVPKEIAIMEVITVSELARKMNLKASELISKLMSMGMMVTINQQIDAETASILAEEYGCKVNIVSLYDETIIETEEDQEQDLQHRPPIVTVMGHVDHGKTKLLDAIRTANVVDTEFGGITQHIGAYKVDLPQGRIVFLDTPGHEAFTTMRARGAQVTDLVVLVVAADDGVMPQTVEAINHAKEAKVPIIVAVNKVDLPDANPDRVRQQLSEYDLVPEAWGGNTLYCEISALKGTGITELLEAIILQAELLELKANYNCRAEGRIVESKIDFGRGIVATVLIRRGTLKIGDSFVAGIYPGKVRAMFNDKGEKVDEVTPSIPVEIVGFTGIPDAGDPFQVTESEKEARQIGTKRQELKKVEEAQNVKKITLDNLYDQIKDGEVQELKVIIKGDVHGSVEALQSALERLGTAEIRLHVIHASAGAINKDDVMLASASNAIIVGFNVRPIAEAQATAEREKVEIRRYNIIYDVVDDIRAAMEGMLAPELQEKVMGSAEVRNLFKVPKIGIIAGCYVTSGKIRRGASVRLVRDGVDVYTGKISSLRRFKEDAREVESGFECGIGIENYNDLKVGDVIEAFEVVQLAKTLESAGARRDVGSKAEEG
ncbi:MAG: translation initiation factor IF-2 [Spirochaetales bacterium]|nr:translation initiation factor IF-2 [Spirochaetales bacterium]